MKKLLILLFLIPVLARAQFKIVGNQLGLTPDGKNLRITFGATYPAIPYGYLYQRSQVDSLIAALTTNNNFIQNQIAVPQTANSFINGAQIATTFAATTSLSDATTHATVISNNNVLIYSGGYSDEFGVNQFQYTSDRGHNPVFVLNVDSLSGNTITGMKVTMDTLRTTLNDGNANTVVRNTDLTPYQLKLNGTGFVKASGTSVSYDNSTYLTTGTAASTYQPIGSYITSGSTAGGDLTGTYPNPTVNMLNGITKSFYDPVSSIQSQLNGKQPNGNYLTGLTGDITAVGPGSAVATLATVNVNTGSWGIAASVPTITLNSKGLTTAASNTPIQITESQVTNLASDLANTVSVSNTRRSANFGISGSLSNVGDLTNTGSSDNTFTASGWVKIDALAAGESLTFYITYTDNEGLVSTIPMTLYGTAATTAITSSSVAVYSLNGMQMRVKAGTDVIMSSVLTGSGTNNYACGAIITNVQGF